MSKKKTPGFARSKNAGIEQARTRNKDRKTYSGRDGTSARMGPKTGSSAPFKIDSEAFVGKNTTVRSGAKSSKTYIELRKQGKAQAYVGGKKKK